VLRIVAITWRNQRTSKELSGGNTRRIYLIEKIINFISDKLKYPSNFYDITIEKLDSNYSKMIALSARIAGGISKDIAAALRELRFYYIDCKTIDKITKESDVIILDHIRSVIMASKCNIKSRKPTIVILHDYHNEFPYGVNSFTRIIGKYYDKLIKKYMDNVDLIIVATVRDLILYKEYLSNANLLVYPNLYYPQEKVKINKDNTKFIINLVTPRVPVNIVIDIVRLIKQHLKDAEIRGINIPNVPGLKNLGTIPSREKYLETLAEGHIGINLTTIGFQSGSNVKRYDYAIAGNVPFNYMNNSIGEPLPHEYTFIDKYDLVAKILSLSLEELVKYGMENAEYTYLKSIEYNTMLKESLYKLLNEYKII